jgi:hypothetical protein
MKSSVQIPRLAGVRFSKIGTHLRAIYHQLDGSIELADVCRCRQEWDPNFRVIRSATCPIDEHSTEAKQLEVFAG